MWFVHVYRSSKKYYGWKCDCTKNIAVSSASTEKKSRYRISSCSSWRFRCIRMEKKEYVKKVWAFSCKILTWYVNQWIAGRFSFNPIVFLVLYKLKHIIFCKTYHINWELHLLLFDLIISINMQTKSERYIVGHLKQYRLEEKKKHKVTV